LAYALAPLYMPSFAPSSTEQIRYVISAPTHLINTLPLKNLEAKFAPTFSSAKDFQQYLLGKLVYSSIILEEDYPFVISNAEDRFLHCLALEMGS
jgi:hypothetical protein